MRLIVTVSVLAACAVGCKGMPAISVAAGEASSTRPAATVVAGDAARGKVRSAELYCDACHGTNGNSETPEWPSLAGQTAAYLAKQMELFRTGARPSPEMQPIANTLTDADIVDLAAHYSAQTPVSGAASDESKLGEALYRDGDAARALAACSSCHGPTGAGNPVTGDPAVRGQQPVYTSRQLEAYANRTRYGSGMHDEQDNPNLAIMYEAAGKLTPEEIRSLAAYMYSMP